MKRPVLFRAGCWIILIGLGARVGAADRGAQGDGSISPLVTSSYSVDAALIAVNASVPANYKQDPFTANDLRDLIEKFIATDYWKDNGGIGDIQIKGRTCTVHANVAIQKQLEAFLNLLAHGPEDWTQPPPADADSNNATVQNLTLKNLAVGDALNELGREARLTVHLHVDPDTNLDGLRRVSMQFANAPAEKMARAILVAGLPPNTPWEARVEDGILDVSIGAPLKQDVQLRLYSFQPFMPYMTAHHIIVSEAAETVCRFLEDTVDSDSWADNGGASGHFDHAGRWLVVAQTPHNHRKIGEALRLLQDGGAREGAELPQ